MATNDSPFPTSPASASRDSSSSSSSSGLGGAGASGAGGAGGSMPPSMPGGSGATGPSTSGRSTGATGDEDDTFGTGFGEAGSGDDPAAGPGEGDDARGDLVDRVARSAHHTIDRLADTAGPHVRRLQQRFSGTDTGGQGADEWRSMGDEWTASLRTSVREHPMAAVACALAAGWLVAKLTR